MASPKKVQTLTPAQAKRKPGAVSKPNKLMSRKGVWPHKASC